MNHKTPADERDKLLTFSEAIALVDDNFWSRQSRSERKINNRNRDDSI
ncbi:MAG: hypothetical protein ACRC06_19525 [Waterburya sp.]